MQTSKLRPLVNLATANHSIVRTVSVSSVTVKANAEQKLKSWKDIPGPSSLPIIGQLFHFLPGGSLYKPLGRDLQDELYKQYGPIVKLEGILGSSDTLFIYDAEAAAQIFHGENLLPRRPALKALEYYRKFYSRKKEDTDKPTGLLTDDDLLWKKVRSIVNPFMLKPQAIKLYANVLDEVALDMVARLKSMRDDKNMIQSNFEIEMCLWAFESISFVELGERLNCIDINLPQDSPTKRLFHVIHDLLTIIEKLEFKPNLWRYISTPTFKKAMRLCEELQTINKSFMEAMEKLQPKNQKLDDVKGVLRKLLEIDENIAVIMANDILIAGVDTIAIASINVLYFLAVNPEKQIKLREEIISKQERKPYIKACIKEAMRIRPVVIGNVRKISRNYNIMGYTIPKDTLVMISHLSTTENQYPRPQEYIPERWITEKDDPLYHGNAHPFAFTPFGFGVRTCIGRRIAELVLETFLARMIENFQVEWFGPPLKSHATLLNYTDPPYNFTFKDAKNI